MTHAYFCDVDELHSFLSGLHSRFGLPIWLTEFHCGNRPGPGRPNHTAADHLRYMKAALPLLDSLAWVERYAWMSVDSRFVPACRLEDEEGRLTELGRAYISL